MRHTWIAFAIACGPRAAPAPHPTSELPPPAIAAVDPEDLCPDHPEDLDGFEDSDGCPDEDNDRDRIFDSDDKCPDQPETYNGTDDQDGCPDRGCLIVRDSPACVFDRVFFERGKSVASARRDGRVLDTIAEAMKLAGTDIELVELRGFRSGDEAAGLSRQRAAWVHRSLVQRGVDASRLAVVDSGVGAPAEAPNSQRLVVPEIVRQRVTAEESDDIVCTPMGHYYRKLGEEERAKRCR